MFNEVESKKILAMALPSQPCLDVYYWWPLRSGEYTVKTAYWLARLGNSHTDYNVDQNNVWRRIWSMECPSKMKHFLWRACKGSLAVVERLHNRQIREDATCLICGVEDETICHALFECTNVKEIWEPCYFKQIVEAAPTGLVKMVGDYINYANCVYRRSNTRPSPSSSSWTPPSQGWVKVNTDAHVINGVKVCLGVAIRDNMGSLKAVGVKQCNPTSVEIAEAEAARYNIELAYRLGFRDIILECDAISVINAISSNAVGSAPIYLVYNDILRLKNQFDNFACKHVKRSGNAIAHIIARWDIYGCNEYVCMSSFPQCILTLAEMDLL
ncbi:hypothetical protein RDABS01_016103 [Bienertia sinuspersici]